MAWVAAVGICGDYGENYRFRYKVLWLSWAIAAVGYGAAIRGLRLTIAEVKHAKR